MTLLDSNLGLPLHQQVRAILLSQIANGELRVGDQLPTEAVLCRHFGVSRVTVRLALKELGDEGLLDRSPGRGTYLRAMPDTSRVDFKRDLVDIRDLVSGWMCGSGEVLRHAWARPPLVATEELGLEPDEEAPYFVKVLDRAKRDWRVAVKRFYLPDLADAVGDRVREARDFDAALGKRLGTEITPSFGWAESILAEPHMIITLRVPLGTPLLSVWAVSRAEGRTVSIAQLLAPGVSVRAGFDL